jgi:hypothetical protein
MWAQWTWPFHLLIYLIFVEVKICYLHILTFVAVSDQLLRCFFCHEYHSFLLPSLGHRKKAPENINLCNLRYQPLGQFSYCNVGQFHNPWARTLSSVLQDTVTWFDCKGCLVSMSIQSNSDPKNPAPQLRRFLISQTAKLWWYTLVVCLPCWSWSTETLQSFKTGHSFQCVKRDMARVCPIYLRIGIYLISTETEVTLTVLSQF